MVYNRVIGIGWDVGGWMGGKHGAIAQWDVGRDGIEWIAPPKTLFLPVGRMLTPDDFMSEVKQTGGNRAGETMIVFGIDAPLGFPVDYVRLVAGLSIDTGKPDREIDSRLAYRETEREIYRVFRKKPLSATFDKP